MDEEQAFPVEVEWLGEGLTRARTASGERLDIATPGFASGTEGLWSPEDMLAGALGSCVALALVSMCETREIPLHDLRVRAVAHVGDLIDGRYGVQRIALELVAETSQRRLEELVRVAHYVEHSCVVTSALAVPVRLRIDVRPVEVPTASAV
jgi:organic hydroperoxide reductase OsmC/OhrA